MYAFYRKQERVDAVFEGPFGKHGNSSLSFLYRKHFLSLLIHLLCHLPNTQLLIHLPFLQQEKYLTGTIKLLLNNFERHGFSRWLIRKLYKKEMS